MRCTGSVNLKFEARTGQVQPFHNSPRNWYISPKFCQYHSSTLELTRFRGHLNVRFGGVRDGRQEYSIYAGF